MIVIIDYNMGNLRSVEKAFLRLGSEAKISHEVGEIEKAGKIILPGVGNFSRGMEKLKTSRLIEVLEHKVLEKKTPVLGICLGMQLFAQHSEEGDVPGLGWIDAQVVRFDFSKKKGDENPVYKKLKIPHMGWNNIQVKKSSPILDHITSQDNFYFVHSYHMVCANEQDILAVTRYGIPFVSAVQVGHIYGMQFHPEKSHSSGLTLLKNFIGL